MLVAVVVQIVGGLRRLLLHVLILVLVYGLPPSSVSLQSHFEHWAKGPTCRRRLCCTGMVIEFRSVSR
jgi:hypothetical protein